MIYFITNYNNIASEKMLSIKTECVAEKLYRHTTRHNITVTCQSLFNWVT